jgi:hypothetical protein
MEKVMEIAEVIDYAEPLLSAERRLRSAKSALLGKNLTDGAEELTQAIADLRIAVLHIKHMQEIQR